MYSSAFGSGAENVGTEMRSFPHSAELPQSAQFDSLTL